MKGIIYVLNENIKNFYRTYSIAKYELMSEMRDSRLGIVWNFLSPLIQIGTYWFVFGIGIRGGKPVNGIDYFQWMIVGILVWFFINPCIIQGTNAIHSKSGIITRMKFPVSILPTTVVLKQLFNHLCMFIIVYSILIIKGFKPSIYNFAVLYYMFCAICLGISLSMVTSVLNMFTRDVKKIVASSMRMLTYVTPILWTMDKLPSTMQFIMKCNPIYYIVQGYRYSFFPYNNFQLSIKYSILFWCVILILFIVGSQLLYKFKYKFIDMI